MCLTSAERSREEPFALFLLFPPKSFFIAPSSRWTVGVWERNNEKENRAIARHAYGLGRWLMRDDGRSSARGCVSTCTTSQHHRPLSPPATIWATRSARPRTSWTISVPPWGPLRLIPARNEHWEAPEKLIPPLVVIGNVSRNVNGCHPRNFD